MKKKPQKQSISIESKTKNGYNKCINLHDHERLIKSLLIPTGITVSIQQPTHRTLQNDKKISNVSKHKKGTILIVFSENIQLGEAEILQVR